MSGYIHTIGFKILVDSEVIDFTFRVPRGTLLIQVLDELEATLKVEPKIVATINLEGEIVVIENHYSPIDYLVQKHGTEYFVGGSNIVTFNHREYVVDLEVPEAIPFASTFRTACKSFSINTREASIERQDGQVMDQEVYSLPTAFVLNSWGNFYRIVDKELGDPLVDPPKAIDFDSKKTIPQPRDFIPITEMVYPPKLDEESEIDQITDHFVESSYRETKVEEREQQYPWQRREEAKEEFEKLDDSSIDSLIDEMTIAEEDQDEFLTRPMEEAEDIEEDKIITDIDYYEEKPKEEILSDILIFEEEEAKDDEFTPEELDKDLDIFAQDYESTTETEYGMEEIEEEEIEEFEESISDLPDIKEPYDEVKEQEEIYVPDLEPLEKKEDEEVFVEEEVLVEEEEEEPFVQVDYPPPYLDSISIPQEEKITPDTQKLEDLTEELVIDSEITPHEDAFVITEREQIEPPHDDLPLDQRLELRKKELEALEIAIKEEEQKKIQQRTIDIEYYEKMNPRKIFPLTVKIPPLKNGNNHHESDVVRITPIFPGCYVTPHEEFISLKSEEEELIEFNITPLIGQGKLHGKISVSFKGRSLININTVTKIRNYLGVIITALLAFVFGLLPFILMIFGVEVNEALKDGFNATFSTSITAAIFMWIEIVFLVVFLGLMVGFIFIGKPSKKKITRKFYPVAKKEE